MNVYLRERERERAKPHRMILSLSPVFGHVGEQSTEKCLSERLTTLRPVASDGHTHSLTQVLQLLPNIQHCGHVTNVNEILLAPSLQPEKKKANSYKSGSFDCLYNIYTTEI